MLLINIQSTFELKLAPTLLVTTIRPWCSVRNGSQHQLTWLPVSELFVYVFKEGTVGCQDAGFHKNNCHYVAFPSTWEYGQPWQMLSWACSLKALTPNPLMGFLEARKMGMQGIFSSNGFGSMLIPTPEAGTAQLSSHHWSLFLQSTMPDFM